MAEAPAGSRQAPTRAGPEREGEGEESVLEPFLSEYAVRTEFNLLAKNPKPGVYVRPRDDDIFVWDGAIFLRQGDYSQAVFRFEIRIPPAFPKSDEVPRVVFNSEVFHPMIDPATRELNLSARFPVWRPRQDRLWRLVHHIRRAFYKVDPEAMCNEEAARVKAEDEAIYQLKVREAVRSADIELYAATNPSNIRFSSLSAEEEAKALQDMARFQAEGTMLPLPSAAPNAQTSGLSWMKESTPFAKRK